MRIKRVREIAAGNAIDASRERVVTNLGCIVQCSSVTRTGTASIDRDGHSGRRIGVDCASIEVAREGVIAAEPFKLVERAEVAVVCARSAVGRSVVNVREHRTLYALDRTQCVVSDRCIACGNGGGSTGAQVDGDATCDGVHVIVTGDIETAATIHEIVAADPREGVVEPAAQQVIFEHRSQYGVHSGGSVGPDGRVPSYCGLSKKNGNAGSCQVIVVLDRYIIAAPPVDQVVAATPLVVLVRSIRIVAAEQRVIVGGSPDAGDLRVEE